ncbi:MAG: type II secretion system protein [Deltaproteobacteria bacterium]|nr:type II secretion system protein [Deltaproteobacteria bacterium]
MRKPRTSGEDGFTLLEAVVSLAILSGVIVTIIYSINYNLKTTERLKTISTATNLAREFFQEMDVSGVPDVREGAFPDRPGFTWRLEMEDMSIEGVKKLKLDVTSGVEAVSIETYRLTQ